ncbi:TPM domain-containing protein [Bizionia myxarmorum]|uniref:TPM domain-containing protein n=1 Tax=Bizionia myxarmorum TaxID=291186 RepID=A0A5D0RB30_9FLAO|nr:TPM domain-containing protein [Bizionia myxarmorum]TYB78722.1 TPM domain-containing protein [Bizionia myxarmorum]
MTAQTDYPVLTEFCTDNAQLFTADEVLALNTKLKNFEIETTHQIVVVTVNSLENNSIEEFALRVYEINKIGQKGEDNGLLILIAKDDREFRIEVGYGLEPIITDALASRITRNIMTPEFKNGDFYKGVDLATDEIINFISNPKYAEELTNVDEFANVNEVNELKNMPFVFTILIACVVFAFLGVFIFVGGALFMSSFRKLINLYKGLITGKVSVLSFPFVLIGLLFTILFSLPFIIVPLIFAIMFSGMLFFNKNPDEIYDAFYSTGLLTIPIGVSFVGIIIILLPVILAFLGRKNSLYDPIKFSFLKSDKRYMTKNFSSSGSSSGSSHSSRSPSSRSSSSFSGGGGRSGGGGSSGRW